MKTEINKTYLTREGRKARVLCTDLKGTDYPVACAVTYEDLNLEHIFSYQPDGARWKKHKSDKDDLVSEYLIVNDVEFNKEDKEKAKTDDDALNKKSLTELLYLQELVTEAIDRKDK